jgi:hypothetical protein
VMQPALADDAGMPWRRRRPGARAAASAATATTRRSLARRPVRTGLAPHGKATPVLEASHPRRGRRPS